MRVLSLVIVACEEARCAADIRVGQAGNRGKPTAFALGAEIPALLREGALEALARQWDVSRDISMLRNQGLDIPLELTNLGRDVLSVASSGWESSKLVRGPTCSASHFA